MEVAMSLKLSFPPLISMLSKVIICYAMCAATVMYDFHQVLPQMLLAMMSLQSLTPSHQMTLTIPDYSSVILQDLWWCHLICYWKVVE